MTYSVVRYWIDTELNILSNTNLRKNKKYNILTCGHFCTLTYFYLRFMVLYLFKYYFWIFILLKIWSVWRSHLFVEFRQSRHVADWIHETCLDFEKLVEFEMGWQWLHVFGTWKKSVRSVQLCGLCHYTITKLPPIISTLPKGPTVKMRQPPKYVEEKQLFLWVF